MSSADPFSRQRPALSALRDERGIAIPVVLIVITIGFALASIGALAAIGSIRNAGRDTSDKGALGIAEAGAEQALFRQNQILTNPAQAHLRCLAVGSGEALLPTSPQADGWCATQSGAVNGGTYRYRIQPDVVNEELGQRTVEIISEGTLNGETRRIQLTATASTGTPAFGGGQLVGLNSFTLDCASEVTGAMRTNADLHANGKSCNGDSSVGSGKHLLPNPDVCNGAVLQGLTTLGPVDQGDVVSNNSNARLVNGDDHIQAKDPSKVWNPDARTLNIKNKEAVTLGGQNYSLCSLNMTGGALYAADGAQVRIYFDTPENCDGETMPINTNGGMLSATSGVPDDLALLVVGADTDIRLNGNGTSNNVVIYAPLTDIKINGGSDYRGAVAGMSLDIRGNGSFTGVESSLSFTTPVELAYKPERFVECVGPMTTTEPGTGC